MATIDKLNYLNETKSQIKSALNDLGAEITDEDTFRSYVEKINELYAEYPTEEQVQAIQLQSIQSQVINQPLNIELEPQDIEIKGLKEPQEEVEEIQEEEIQEESEEVK